MDQLYITLYFRRELEEMKERKKKEKYEQKKKDKIQKINCEFVIHDKIIVANLLKSLREISLVANFLRGIK